MTPCKVCLVTGAYPKYVTGGAELQLYLLARELVKRNYEVHFTTFDHGQDTPDVTLDEGIIVHTLRYRIPFLGYLRALWRALSQADADLYLNRALGYTLVTWLFARRHGRKFIYAVSSMPDCMPRRVFKGKPQRWPYAARARVNQFALCRADRVVAQAEYQKTLLESNFNVHSTILRNGLPLPGELPAKKDPPVVLWLANLKRLKQAEVFIQLAQECRNLPCPFVWAGRADDGRYLNELLDRMKGMTNLTYVGALTLEQANEWIAQSSVLVNTSLYEGFPNTFIQAWMRRVPVVSLNVDPDDTLVREGIGFKSGTFENLRRDVAALITDRSLRESMGQRAQIYATAHHSLESFVDGWVEVFRSVLAGTAAEPRGPQPSRIPEGRRTCPVQTSVARGRNE
jgi:glycosyltransferase involved in cell wall biosynthesis